MEQNDLYNYSLRDKGFYPVISILGSQKFIEKHINLTYLVSDRKKYTEARKNDIIPVHIFSEKDLDNVENTTQVNEWLKTRDGLFGNV